MNFLFFCTDKGTAFAKVKQGQRQEKVDFARS